MNPWDLSASDLLIWGLVLHLIADWPLQNDWMANNKMKRRRRAHLIHEGNCLRCDYRWHKSDQDSTCVESGWYDRHPAAYVHASIHGALLALAFGWVAIPLAIAHLIIDTRVPVVWWSKFVKQTQPGGMQQVMRLEATPRGSEFVMDATASMGPPVMDIGLEVRFWTDQVFHIACIAVAALLVGV